MFRSFLSSCRGVFLRRCGSTFGQRIILPLHSAFEQGTGFYRNRLVNDLTFNMGTPIQPDAIAADLASDPTIDNDLIRYDLPLDDCLLANLNQFGIDVSVDSAVDLHVAV